MASSIKFGLSALSMAIMLAACGGGDSGGGSLIGTPSNPDGGGTPTEPSEQPPELRLGTGTGNAFQSGQITVTNKDLAAGGRTGLEVNVIDLNRANALVTGESTTIQFTSNCAAQIPPRAQFTLGADAVDEVSTRSGIAKITYEALGCIGDDTITATLPNGARATTNVSVAPPVLNSVVFDRVGMNAISIAGFGTQQRPDTTVVSFAVLDNTGNPVEGIPVNFSLSSSLGGIKLSTNRTETDTAGIAKAFVNAGIVNTEVRVIAKADGIPGTTISDPIAINTGLPDQDSFSISVSSFNPDGGNRDNINVDVLVIASDAYNNPVRDGTAINFVASGGTIQNSCVTENGRCSVTWSSADPRPENRVVRILARSVGEESFVDSNSNGLFDPAEKVWHLSDAWLDADGDGRYDAFADRDNYSTNFRNGFIDYIISHQWRDTGGYYERFFDYLQTGSFTPSDDRYQGLACSEESDQLGLCDRSLIETRATASLIMASNDIGIDICLKGSVVFDIDGTGNWKKAPADGACRIADMSSISDATQADLMVNVAPGAAGADGIPSETICFDFYGRVFDTDSGLYISEYDHTPPEGSAVSITTDNGKLSGRTTYNVPNQYRFGRKTASNCITISNDGQAGSGVLQASIDVNGLEILAPSITVND